jgi:hypothetical protein
MSELRHNPSIGRRLRSGPAEALGVPTDRLAVQALERGSEEAGELLDYHVTEVQSSLASFSTWVESLIAYAKRELPNFEPERERLLELIGPFVPAGAGEPLAEGELAAARAALEAGDAPSFGRALDRLRERHRATIDAYSDWAWGVLSVLQEELGEGRMGAVLRETQQGWHSERYAALGRMEPREIFELAMETMRALLGGPARDGGIQVEEDDEKWVMSFDPCGTGGRMRRGDRRDGRAPRTEAPFSFAEVEGAYDWTWQREGVCLYCAHCAMVNEIAPIEMFGFPMRVTDYPDEPGAPCTWTVYKAPELVPDWAFERVGKRRPGAPESKE